MAFQLSFFFTFRGNCSIVHLASRAKNHAMVCSGIPLQNHYKEQVPTDEELSFLFRLCFFSSILIPMLVLAKHMWVLIRNWVVQGRQMIWKCNLPPWFRAIFMSKLIVIFSWASLWRSFLSGKLDKSECYFCVDLRICFFLSANRPNTIFRTQYQNVKLQLIRFQALLPCSRWTATYIVLFYV